MEILVDQTLHLVDRVVAALALVADLDLVVLVV
jgi:hypothetical protein